jgi:geranyl-CoA carboxylase alpha subunit
MTDKRFQSILVANRGEIAVRVLRTIQSLGYRGIAVYSDADKDAPHTKMADLALNIGPAPATDSYLDVVKVLEAAKVSGAQAIHPGYGFLSENADFARACTDAGLTFIGPSPEAILQMGDKAQAKRLLDGKVPMLPGYQGREQSVEELSKHAKSLGLPLMVKAAAGGGGKGMRLLDDFADLTHVLESARREALSAFGNGDLILERALLAPRHVEIQIIADEQGHVLALGERDCSIQRRHQKVLEEAPSPAVNEELRVRMGAAAVETAKAVNYVGAGTVEFLLDQDGQFYFLEMNTRLQVEHPVTEMVTGLDLVELQIQVAQGQTLTLSQQDIKISGHAIEARLYAEQPGRDFMPSTGTLLRWDWPGAGEERFRLDSGVEQGSVVSSFYDPMLAKVIAHGETRDEARRALARGLKSASVFGLQSNREFLLSVVNDEVFAAGAGVTTDFIESRGLACTAELSALQTAALLGLFQSKRDGDADRRSPKLAGWSNAPWMATPLSLKVGDTTVEARLRHDGSTIVINLGEAGDFRVDVSVEVLRVNGERFDWAMEWDSGVTAWVRLNDRDLYCEDLTLPAPVDRHSKHGDGVLLAPMHGRVVASLVNLGDSILSGDRVIVIEAMKMEQALLADVDGVIEFIAEEGKQVAAGEVLAKIQRNPADGSN